MGKGSFWLGIVGGLVLAGLIFVASPYIGIFDMTATGKPNILDWWGGTNLHTIVERKAVEENIPADASVAGGIEHYASTCLLCHGAPETPRRPWAESMLPQPPELWKEDAQHMSDGGIYYIVDNGIRMTGMPAFGPDHSDDEIWNLVATVRQLETLSAEQRQHLTQAAQSGGHGHGQGGEEDHHNSDMDNDSQHEHTDNHEHQ